MVMFMPVNKMLWGTTGRAPEPEAEQDRQSGAENMTENREVVRVLIAREMAPVEYGHVADRASCVFGVTNVGQSPGNKHCKQ